MPDDLTKRGKPDGKQAAGAEKWEVDRIAKKYNVSQETAKKVVRQLARGARPSNAR